jgi:hypothetical protein
MNRRGDESLGIVVNLEAAGIKIIHATTLLALCIEDYSGGMNRIFSSVAQ